MLGHGITVELKPSLTSDYSELRLNYIPTPPAFTIRAIMSAVKSMDQTLNVNLVQELTVEERAEVLTRKEQNSLLKRLLAAFIFSIPTFIFGIVFMSLLPSHSSVRQYFEANVDR